MAFVLALLGALALGWHLLRPAPTRVRALLRACLVVGGIVAAPKLVTLGREQSVTGTRQCDLCGKLERLVTIAGVRSVGQPKVDADDAVALDAYAAWIAPILGEHEHEWAKIGCWSRGTTISCTMRPPVASWHVMLPRVADAELAERAARAFLAADPKRRREWIELRDSSAAGGRLSFGERDDAERQEIFERWLQAELGAS